MYCYLCGKISNCPQKELCFKCKRKQKLKLSQKFLDEQYKRGKIKNMKYNDTDISQFSHKDLVKLCCVLSKETIIMLTDTNILL